MEKYSRGKNVGYPIFHAVAAYDVLNDYFIAAYFDSKSGDERKAAIKLLDDTYFDEKEQIFLYDRGFPSVALLQKLEQRGKKYVMRVSSSFLKEVNEFTASKAVDKTISVHYTSHRGQSNRVCAQLPNDFELRCVRIHLNSGEDEVCVTNLDKEAFPKRRIKELYGLRWGIECGFNFLKNAVFVEEFTSKSENGIQQDFYSSLWCADMINLMIVEACALKKTKNEKTKL